METQMIQAELRAVEQHRFLLSQERGYDVGFEEAKNDWLAHYSQEWREKRHAAMLAMERHEIDKHKWIESEKVGVDLGRQAQLEWIMKYAASWRAWYEQEYEETESGTVAS